MVRMGIEIKTFWVNRAAGGYHNEMKEIASMLDEGWELVDWHPVIARTGAEYDTFLLRKPARWERDVKVLE